MSLDITGLRSSDEGLYECKATNSLGEAVTAASCRVAAKGSLILDSQHPEGMRKITQLERARATHKQVSDEQQSFDKPVFVTPLTGTSVVAEGQQAHMECRVVPLGDASMNVNWFKNGEALQVHTMKIQKLTEKSSVKILKHSFKIVKNRSFIVFP